MSSSSEKRFSDYLGFKATTKSSSSSETDLSASDAVGASTPSRTEPRTKTLNSELPKTELPETQPSKKQHDNTIPHKTFGLPEVLSYCLSSDLSTLLYCSSNASIVLGCPLHQVKSNGALLLRHIHADDRFRVLNSIEDALVSSMPSSVAYRWIAPDTGKTQLLFNHCAPAHSDQGEIISGIIVRIDSELSKEISLVSGFGLNAAEHFSDETGSARILLDESLTPLSPPIERARPSKNKEDKKKTSTQKTTPLSLLIEELLTHKGKRRLIEKLSAIVTTGSRKIASENLFYGARVIKASMKRITKDTFTPYFLLTLQDISKEFLEKEELKSLRKSRSKARFLRKLIKPLSKKLKKIKSLPALSEPEHRELLQETCSIVEQIDQTLSHQRSRPFVNASQMLIRTLGEISSELPSHTEIHVDVPSSKVWLWKSIAREAESLLFDLQKWISINSFDINKITANIKQKQSLSTQPNFSEENSRFGLYLNITMNQTNHSPPLARKKEGPSPVHRHITPQLSIERDHEKTIYTICFNFTGCFER